MVKSLVPELNRIKNRIGLVSGTLTVNEYDDVEENVSAHINSKNWNIEFNLRTGFDPVNDRRQKAYAKLKKIQDGLDKADQADIRLKEIDAISKKKIKEAELSSIEIIKETQNGD